MSFIDNKDGYPILENYNDIVLYWNSFTRRQEAGALGPTVLDRTMNMDVVLHMIASLMKSHENRYCVSNDKEWELWFPYLFSQPSAGDNIVNLRTREIYVIKQVLFDPATKTFQGHILLETGISSPRPENGDVLAFINSERYVKFVDEYPLDVIGKERVTSEGHGTKLPPFVPTIANVLIREQPAGTRDFLGDAGKELKPRLRESKKSLTRSGTILQIYEQVIDTLVQFDCYAADPQTARLLVRWFQGFVQDSTWIIKKNGVKEIIFVAKLRDLATERFGQNLYSHSIQYGFRTGNISTHEIQPIVQINQQYNVEQIISPERPQVYVAGQYIDPGSYTNRLRDSIFYDNDGSYRFGSISAIDNGF